MPQARIKGSRVSTVGQTTVFSMREIVACGSPLGGDSPGEPRPADEPC